MGMACDCRRPGCRACGSAGRVTVDPGVGVDTACRHEGPVVEWAPCGNDWKHVRQCLHDEAEWDTCVRGKTAGAVQSCATCRLRDAGDRHVVRVTQTVPPDAEPPAADVIVDQGGSGIGDGLLGLLAANGLRATLPPGATLEYRVSEGARPFVALFDGYDSLGAHARGHNTRPTPGATQLNLGYDDGLRDGTPFVERYCKNLSFGTPVTPLLPAVRDPHRLARLAAEYAGCVVLAPKSAHASREWSLHHWRDLARMLKSAGYSPLAVADKAVDVYAESLIRPTPEKLAGVMLNAACVIGNDSGPAHLAGVLGRPTIVLTGPTTVGLIYGAYPNVTGLEGKLHCRGCRWQYPYLPDRCQHMCASLQTVLPADVVEAVERIVPRPHRKALA